MVVCTCIFVVITNTDAFAQTYNSERGVVNGTAVDSLTRQPLSSANIVFVTSWGDTIRAATNHQGVFNINYGIKPGLSANQRAATIHVSYVGYTTRTAKIAPLAPKYSTTIQIAQKVVDIDKIDVMGRTMLISSKGYTIVYNASVLNSMENETAADVMKKLPGLTVEESGNKKILSHNGVPIETIFVNGRLVFGSDVSDAMDYVQARDINKIYVFDQKHETEQNSGE